MRTDADTDLHAHESAPEAAVLDHDPARRRRRLGVILAGTLTGLIVGGAAVVLINNPRVTGSSENPVVWLVGLPALLAIAGTVIGWVVAGLLNAEVEDSPARERRFRRRGRAATAVDGQEPGSEVPPRYRPGSPAGHSH
jgi:hypothetical protein